MLWAGIRRSYRPRGEGRLGTQSDALGWYTVSRWDTGEAGPIRGGGVLGHGVEVLGREDGVRWRLRGTARALGNWGQSQT